TNLQISSSTEDIYPTTLSISPAATDKEKASALCLVADGVIQQQEVAAKYIISHPAVLVASITILSVVTKVLYTRSPVDQMLVMGVWAGCAMAGLLAIRLTVSGYLGIAERVRTL